MGGFGSFGRKAGAAAPKPRKERAYDDRAALHSEEDADEEDDYARPPPREPYGRTRSSSTLSAANQEVRNGVSLSGSGFSYESVDAPVRRAPSLKRTHTSPGNLNARYVKALFAYHATQVDELDLRVGQVIEVKTEISADWLTGESEGRSGMFPAAYCEEYVPTPRTAVPAGVPPPRRLPPGVTGSAAVPVPVPVPTLAPLRTNVSSRPTFTSPGSIDYAGTSDSEMSQGYDDADHYATASLSMSAQPSAASASATPTTRSRSGTVTSRKGPAPPPPPSRRSASSTNVLAAAGGAGTPPIPRSRANTLGSGGGSSRLGVAQPGSGYNMDSSPEGSPFGGSSPFAVSEDEGAGAGVRAGGGRPQQQQQQQQQAGMTRAMSGLQLPSQVDRGAEAGEPACGTCGCDDFTQNLFKGKGSCSTCYHAH